MAKGSAMGLWRGKKGSSVFYRITNSNNAQKQGIRERVYEPKNPQSYSQAGQRMKMLPASRVYQALKEVIERSWQGVPYGSVGRNYFMRYALRSDLFPALAKGDAQLVPGAYRISDGSIQPVICSYDAEGLLTISLTIGQAQLPETVGELAQLLIDNNSNIERGDQVTIVLFVSNIAQPASGIIVQRVSFYCNPGDTTSIEDKFSSIELDVRGSQLYPFVDGFEVCASACIISRDGSYPLRSQSELALNLNAAAMMPYYSPEARSAARKSYQKRVYERANWQVDPIDGTLSEDEEAGSFTLTGLTGQMAVFNGRQALVRYLVDADGVTTMNGVYFTMANAQTEGGTIENQPCLIDYTTRSLMTHEVTDPESGETTILAIGVQRVAALADLEQIPFE